MIIALYNDDAEERQAEYMPASRKDIATRLKANITLLRLLREGLEVEEATKELKELIGV